MSTFHPKKSNGSYFTEPSENDDLLHGIEHIDALLNANLRFVYDVENMLDEYNLVPKMLAVINSQTPIVINEMEQRRVIVEGGNIEILIAFLEKYFEGFNYRRANSGQIEVLFDTTKDADLCIATKAEVFRFFRSQKYFASRSFEVTDLELDDKLIIGPLDIDEMALKAAFVDIGGVLVFRQCYDFVCDKKLNFFVVSFKNKPITKHLVGFLSPLIVNNRTLTIIPFYENISAINLNEMFFNKFGVSGHVLTSTIETRIIQVLNMFLPGDVSCLEKVHDIKKLIKGEIDAANIVDIYIPLSFYSKKVPYCDSEGRVYIECRDIDSARAIFYGLGGLILNDRVVITSFFPEYHYKAREFV